MSLLWVVASREISPAADDVHPNVEHYQSGGIGHQDGDESRSVVGMVPTHVIEQYREHDGNQQHPDLRHKDRAIIDGIREDIQSGKGITNPIHVEYDHEKKWGTIGEGNHRLAAAREEGLTHVPVRVYGRAHKGRAQQDGIGAPLHMSTKWKGGMGEDYVPPDVHPHHFKELAP